MPKGTCYRVAQVALLPALPSLLWFCGYFGGLPCIYAKDKINAARAALGDRAKEEPQHPTHSCPQLYRSSSQL